MSDTPAWLESLVDVVAAAMTAYGPIGPMGLRYRETEEGTWDVLIYPLPLELIGGAHDGGLAAPYFSLDLNALCAAFTPVDSINWHAHEVGDENSPCITISGIFDDYQVWLRVLAYAPADVGPGMKVDTTGRRQAG